MTEPNEILSDKWLRRAQRLNPYYRERLAWALPADWPSDIATAAFALRVAAFQKEGSLTVDGVLGPKTLAALGGGTFAPPAGEFLIVRGEKLPVPFPIVSWEEPGGLSFYGRKGWPSVATHRARA